MLNRELIKVVISLESNLEEGANQLKYLKAVKLVEEILMDDEEVTKKPASEKILSENTEFVIITELETA